MTVARAVRDPESGVRLIGAAVAYADGAEAEVLRALSRAADRSTASDELAARINEGPGAVEFVDQLRRWPCSADASAPSRLTDDRRAHRVFLEAGLGPEVANSLLVLAGGKDVQLDRLAERQVKAWHFGSDRQRRFLAVKKITVGSAFILTSVGNYSAGITKASNATVAVSCRGLVSAAAFLTTGNDKTDVFADATGYFAPAGTAGKEYIPLGQAQRIADTQYGPQIGNLAAGVPHGFFVKNQGPTPYAMPPSGVTAVALNSTVVFLSGPGYLVHYPSDVSQPLASNINYNGSGIVPNGASSVSTRLATMASLRISCPRVARRHAC